MKLTAVLTDLMRNGCPPLCSRLRLAPVLCLCRAGCSVTLVGADRPRVGAFRRYSMPPSPSPLPPGVTGVVGSSSSPSSVDEPSFLR